MRAIRSVLCSRSLLLLTAVSWVCAVTISKSLDCKDICKSPDPDDDICECDEKRGSTTILNLCQLLCSVGRGGLACNCNMASFPGR
ncbi:hypothetical protein RRG08_034903 [Elysia crispata]|uniref:Uncharacterized protein n=1 Tax=Elysia crispata TaxID=231223 RepID=A0AAE0YQS0_9GAST|nr:hypothetical protein RRG08_034903 [Elysia crispata]